MGMSASQVRFLSLQHRKHNVGRQLTALSNRKMALSRDMQQVSRNYTNALNQIHLKFSNNCGSNNYTLNYDLLMKPNELNAETPLIITDKQGRVVVDDNEVTYEKNGETVHTGVTYKELAELISSYSGVDQDGNVLYKNTDRVNGTSGLACAIEDGYKIAQNASQYDYNVAMRYDILNRLGIVTDSDYAAFNSVQKAYYGSKEAMEKNLYADVAVNDTKGTQEYMNEQISIKTANAANENNPNYVRQTEYSDVFGVLQVTETGALTIEGGSTLGNIELVKQYLEEFDLYLNTDIKQKAVPNSQRYNTDNVKTNIKSDEYAYSTFSQIDDEPTQGITNRIVDMLTRPSNVDEEGNDVFNDEVSSDGTFRDGQDVLEMLASTTTRALLNSGRSYWTGGEGPEDPYYNGWGGDTDGQQSPGLYNRGYADPYISWGYNHSNSYDNPISWSYFYSSKSDTGFDTVAIISGFYNDGEDQYVDSDELYCNGGNLTNILRAFSNSLESTAASGKLKYDEAAARYAETMTYIKFANNFRLFEWGADYKGDGTGGLEQAIHNSLDRQLCFSEDRDHNSGWREEYQIHAQHVYYSETSCAPAAQTAWVIEDQDGGTNAGKNGILTSTSDDSDSDACVFGVDLPCLINTYITFYTAYIESHNTTGSDPVVAWKSNNQMYYSVNNDWSASNVQNNIVDNSWNTTSTEYSVVLANDNKAYTSFRFYDSNKDGIDDATGLAESQFQVKNFEGVKKTVKVRGADGKPIYDANGNAQTTEVKDQYGNNIIVDKEYGVTQEVYNYLKNFKDSNNKPSSNVNDAYKTSTLSAAAKKEIESFIYETDVNGNFVDANGNVLEDQNDESLRVYKKGPRYKKNDKGEYLDASGNVLQDQNDVSLRVQLPFDKYGELNDLCANIQSKVYNVTQSTNIAGATKYKEVVQSKVANGVTSTATSRYDLNTATLLERTVIYSYQGTVPSGAPLTYNEKIDENGNRVACVQSENNTNSEIANSYTGGGAWGSNGCGITICQINSSNGNTYVIGGQEQDTRYSNYLYTKPSDTANVKEKLTTLLKELTDLAVVQAQEMNEGYNNIENKTMEFFDTLFKRISENGWVYDEKVNNPDNTKASAQYLDTMFQNNQYFITEAKEINENGKYQYAMKQATSVNKIYQVHDEDAENAALAVYESEKTAISSKERQIDTRMAMLETEQEAINTELESIKKVRNDNIEKYFKIFA